MIHFLFYFTTETPLLTNKTCEENCAGRRLDGTCERCRYPGLQAPYCCECVEGFTKRGNTCVPAYNMPAQADSAPFLSHLTCEENCAGKRLDGTCDSCLNRGFQAPYCCECVEGFTKRGNYCVPAYNMPAQADSAPSLSHLTCEENCAGKRLDGTCDSCLNRGFQAPYCCECVEGFTKRGNTCVPAYNMPAQADSTPSLSHLTCEENCAGKRLDGTCDSCLNRGFQAPYCCECVEGFTKRGNYCY